MTLTVENMTALYRNRTYAAVDVGFSCTEGEILGIAGPSGAGKSTLGRCIAGLQQPLTGTIRVDGTVLNINDRTSRKEYRRTVQLVFQDPLASLPSHMQVRIPLFDAAKLAYNTVEERERALTALVEELHLEQDLLYRRPSQLSGGQRQRISLARALIVGARFIILDEVTSALDSITEQRILNLLMEYRKRHGLGIMFISHDIGLLLEVCTRLIIYYYGEIVELGVPETIFRTPSHYITRQLIASLPETAKRHLADRFGDTPGRLPTSTREHLSRHGRRRPTIPTTTKKHLTHRFEEEETSLTDYKDRPAGQSGPQKE